MLEKPEVEMPVEESVQISVETMVESPGNLVDRDFVERVVEDVGIAAVGQELYLMVDWSEEHQAELSHS